jgi:hypothetical protein
MWVCDACGRRFAARGQVHSCRPAGELEPWFDGVEPAVRAAFDAIVAALARHGPFEVIPERSRIAFHHRMSFAVVVPRRRWLNGHLVLAEPVASPRFHRVTTFSVHNHVHEFRLRGPDEVDTEFRGWLAAAWAVGAQHHRRPPATGR